MSLESELHGFLAGTLSVGERVYPFGKRPQGTSLSSVTYLVVGGPSSHYSHGGVSDHEVSVQLDCWADDQDDAIDLAYELDSALDGYRGSWGALRIGSVFQSVVLDDYEEKTNTYRRMRQFDIHYSEPFGS